MHAASPAKRVSPTYFIKTKDGVPYEKLGVNGVGIGTVKLADLNPLRVAVLTSSRGCSFNLSGAQMVSVHFFASRTRSNRLGK